MKIMRLHTAVKILVQVGYEKQVDLCRGDAALQKLSAI